MEKNKEVTTVEVKGVPMQVNCVKWGRGKDVMIRTCFPQAI
jgi:hypothetical protein